MGSPKKILITAFGSAGDVLPFIGIGAELVRRKQEVWFIGNPYFAEHAAAAGASFRPVGTLEDYHALMKDLSLFHWKTAREAKAMEHFVHIVDPTYLAMTDLHDPGRTVVLGPGATSIAWMAVEKHNIPMVGGMIAPARCTSVYDPPHPPRPLPFWAEVLSQSKSGLRSLYRLGRAAAALRQLTWRRSPAHAPGNPLLDEINRVRANAQLSKISDISGTGAVPARRILCMWPDWYASKQNDWPAGAETIGFVFYPAAGGGANSASALRHEQKADAPVVFTSGSVASNQEDFFRAAVQACQIVKRPGILVTPHENEVPQPLPRGITHVISEPFARLFARAALVVHHGGVGTIALALAAGVPQIVRPIMGEQFDLGNRTRRLGVGRMLTREKITARELAKAIDSTLRSRRISERCRYWQSRIDRQSGALQAAEIVESIS